MSIYYVPALFGLVTKLLIFVLALKRHNVSATFITLVVVFACHNAVELIGYLRFLDDQTVDALFRSYYAATIIMLMALTLHVQNISKFNVHSGPKVVITVSLVLALMMIGSDLLIAGNYSIGYALTAVKGPYYWVFASYALAILFANIGMLIYGARCSTDELKSAQCLYSLYALAPLMLACLVVLALKLLAIDINAAGIIPIATTWFLFMTLKSESKHQLTDIRRLLPFSLERKSAAEFLRLTDAYAQNSNAPGAFAELRDGLERQAILYTLEKCDNNVTQAAQMMGLQNRSTLYSMMKRLDITPLERSKLPSH